MRSPKLFLGALCVALAAAFTMPCSATGLMIDDFTVASVVVQCPSCRVEQLELPTANALFGHRIISNTELGDASSDLAVFGGSFVAFWDLRPGPSGGASVTLSYRSPSSSGANLTVGDRIAIDLPVVELSSGTSATMTVRLTDGTFASDTAQVPFSTPGRLEFPLNLFPGVDLTDIREVSVMAGSAAVRGPSNWSISEIKVVPEPTTALLFVSGLAGLAVWGRRAR